MKNENDELLKNQIGNIGGLEEQVNSLEGKKLKNTPGAQKELSREQDEEMQEFLSRSRSRSKITKHEDVENQSAFPRISEGWNEIDRIELGIRSQFYPDDWSFYIRPATVDAIKNWSAIDEERIDVLNTVFNDIIRSCVSIKSATGNIPWNRINSWDRFWFILKVRELTFKQGEAKIEFSDTCSECDEEIYYNLNPKSLFYEFPDDEIVNKHWNPSERIWYIDPNDYGLDRSPIRLYIPTLEKDQAILDWGIAKARANKKLDQTFLRFLPWMLSKVPKDAQVLDKFIMDCLQVYKSWDVEMFEFMDEVIRNVTINPSEKLRQVCPHCGEEVVSNVRFPNGVRALFKTEAKHIKFGSR